MAKPRIAKGARDVKSARRSVAFLELLLRREDGDGVPLKDFAKEIGVPVGSAHALLQTLTAAGLLTRNKHKAYEISDNWLALMRTALSSRASSYLPRFRQALSGALLELSVTLGVTCNLAVMRGHDIVYIDTVESASAPIRLSATVGATLPAHASASGKALLAARDPREWEPWLEDHNFEAVTPYTITAPTDLMADLAEAASRGYAVELEEFRIGVISVAASVVDRGGNPVAAISATDLAPAITALGIAFVGEKVRSVAEAVSGTHTALVDASHLTPFVGPLSMIVREPPLA
ncbi:MAG: IclR family transcriptional regulator [Gaiellaceae bacterium]